LSIQVEFIELFPDPVQLEQEPTLSICDTTIPGSELSTDQLQWEDEDQRSFYTNLLDLKAIVPAVRLQDN